MWTHAGSRLRPIAIVRLLGWLSVAALVGLAAMGPSAAATRAASVTPTPIDVTKNQTCQDLAALYGGGQTWLEVKFDPPKNGSQDVTVGGTTYTITVSNLKSTSFDWSSTLGIDAVFVKSGKGGSNLYVYAPTSSDPESFGDTNLTTRGGKAISHISFCYDSENPAPSPTPTPTEEA
ncbi:MAG: hypothetical protein C4343_02615, partial [Chloroflexota bacterium]